MDYRPLGNAGVSSVLVGYSSLEHLEQAVDFASRGPLPSEAIGRLPDDASGPRAWLTAIAPSVCLLQLDVFQRPFRTSMLKSIGTGYERPSWVIHETNVRTAQLSTYVTLN